MCEPPIDKLLWYAEKFDVSLDYIFGRTYNPQGMLCHITPSADIDSSEIHSFVEMCFDPKSSVNQKLKQTLIKLLEEEQK